MKWVTIQKSFRKNDFIEPLSQLNNEDKRGEEEIFSIKKLTDSKWMLLYEAIVKCSSWMATNGNLARKCEGERVLISWEESQIRKLSSLSIEVNLQTTNGFYTESLWMQLSLSLTSFLLLSHYLHSFNLVFHISSSERKYSLKRGQSNTWAETGKKKAERYQAGDYIT